MTIVLVKCGVEINNIKLYNVNKKRKKVKVMRLYEFESNIILEGIKDFSLEQTLECGQCFHFKKIGDNEYGISACNRLLHIKQDGDKIIMYNTTLDEYNDVWKEYFDLNTDYGAIKKHLLKEDEKLKDAIETMWGVRLLKQDFFETLISFIISQNKQIPHIKQIVAAISKEYGTYLGKIGEEEFYSFPTEEQMLSVSEDALRACKTGFRAPYICDAVSVAASGKLNVSELQSMDVEMCREALMQIKGVGSKVANCVMLFGLQRYEAFPVDVWIKRIVEELYFDGVDTPKEKIEQFGVERYGKYGGFAQQYLFYYGKTMNLGVKK